MSKLLQYALHYSQVMGAAGMDFDLPQHPADFEITDRAEGNTTTDFEAPAIILPSDYFPAERADFQAWRKILAACWQVFNASYQKTLGRELQKGPRGGGRDAEKILSHLIEGDRAYLSRLVRSYQHNPGLELTTQLELVHQQILSALDAAEKGALPALGPRGGKTWPIRFFVRRSAWHTLDHLWEIEDRLITS